MKKLLALLMIACMLVTYSIAVAEDSLLNRVETIMSKLNSQGSAEFDGTDEEGLLAIIAGARAELGVRTAPIANGDVFYEDENIRITINSDPYIEYETLTIDVVVENFSSSNILVSIENCTINGWECYGATVAASADGKSKDNMSFYSVDERVGMNDVSELQDISGVIYYFDTDTYDTIYTSKQQHWLFGETAQEAETEMDFAAMTDEELWNLIAATRLVLDDYDPNFVEGDVIYEDENIRITVIRAPYIEYGALTFDVIVENFSASNILISVEDCKINGWDHSGASISISAACRNRTELSFYNVEDYCEVSDVDDLQEIAGVIRYFDTDTYETIFESNPHTWSYN